MMSGHRNGIVDAVRKRVVRDDGMRAAGLIVAAGMALRFAYLVLQGGLGDRFDGNSGGEACNVAVAFARGAGFADPYFVGSGPTAHLMPTQPLIAGIVVSAFGAGGLASNLILALFALIVVGLAYLTLYRVGSLLGIGIFSRLVVLTGLCAVPVYLVQEGSYYRCWDGGLVVLAGAAALLNVLVLARATRIGVFDDIRSALIVAATLFINPVMGGAAALCHAIHYMLRRSFGQCFRSAVLGVLIAGVIFAPWTLRNYQQFGKIMPFRDNAWLELALANHDRAGTNDPQSYWKRLREIHPLQSPAAQQVVRQRGEVAYFAELEAETKRWIGEHPAQFARLFVRHMAEMIVPPAWHFGDKAGRLQATIVALLNLLGIAGILFNLRRQRQWIYPAITATMLVIGYGAFQPVSRYYYPLYLILAVCAASLIDLAERQRLRAGGLKSDAEPSIYRVEA